MISDALVTVTEADLLKLAPKAKREYVTAILGLADNVQTREFTEDFRCCRIVGEGSFFVGVERAEVPFLPVHIDAGAPFDAAVGRANTSIAAGRGSPTGCVCQIERRCCVAQVSSAVVEPIAVPVINQSGIANEQPVHVDGRAINAPNDIKDGAARTRPRRADLPFSALHQGEVIRLEERDHRLGGVDESVFTTGANTRLAAGASAPAGVAISAFKCLRAGDNSLTANAPTKPISLAFFPISVAEFHNGEVAECLAGDIFEGHDQISLTADTGNNIKVPQRKIPVMVMGAGVFQ